MLQRIFCLFLAVFCFVSGVSPKASASWADIVNDYSIVPFTDFVVDVLQGADKVGDSMTDIMGENFRNILDFWTGLFSSDTSEDDYVSSLEYAALSSDGLPVFYPVFDSLTSSNEVYSSIITGFAGGYIFEATSVPGTSSMISGLISDKAILSLPDGDYQIYLRGFETSRSLGNKDVVDYISGSISKSGKNVETFSSFPHIFSISGGNDSEYSLYIFFGAFACGQNFPEFYFKVDVLIKCISLENTWTAPSAVSRPSSFMQLVNNYNNVDNSTNYFIGTVDADGKVTDVFDPAVYDEDTLVFTEPVTGAQYQTTGWIFDYNTRTYQLSLEPGTFLIGEADIDRIDLTYGDDALTISYYADGVLIQTDTYAYVMATKKDPSTCQHSYTSEITTAATCTAPGVRTYTCSLCGDTYTEEIPQLDHVYTYETVMPPTCIDPGERKGVCSVCGAEVVEDLEPLGHDWQPTSSTQTTYALPEDAACPDCGSTSFDSVLSQSSGSYDCTCSSCGTEWIEQAVITYGQTTYTCTRCGETYVETQNADSGLFASIGNFIANGIGWIVDKLKQLIDSLSGINDIFSDFIADIKSKSGQYPAFLGAVIGVLPEDFMMVFWFAVIAGIVLAVWKLWFR